MAQTFTRVPAHEVEELMRDLRSEGAISVTKTPENGGFFTVVAEFAPPNRNGDAGAGGPLPAGPVAGAAAAPVAATASARATVDAAARAVLGAPPVGARAAAIDTLARTIWGEARGEPREGKEAVAAVVLNRLKRGPAGRFGDTVEACCLIPKHFSCWNEDDVNRPQLLAVTGDDAAFRECVEIATLAIDGRLPDRTSGCDHYHTRAVAPEWSRGKQPKVTIGSHLFFDNIA